MPNGESLDVVLRAANAHDAQQIATLAGQLGYEVSVELMQSRVEQAMRDPARRIVVAEHLGLVIAWMELGLMLAIESGGWAEIRGLVVDQAFRSRGVGERLTREALLWAAQQGQAKVRVRTNEIRTRTHAFYTRCGFTHVKSQRVFEAPVDRLKQK